MCREIALRVLLLIMLSTATVYAEDAGGSEMMTLEFFKSLNFDDGLSVVTDIFERFPLQAIDKAAFVAENIDTVLYIRCQSGT